MRQDRFKPSIGDRTVRFEPRDVQILSLFRHHTILSTPLIHGYVGGGYVGIQNRLTVLSANKYDKHGAIHETGWLGRFTFNGSRNFGAVMNYYLQPKGDRTLLSMGQPERDPYDKTGREHQALIDLVDASIAIASQNSGTEFLNWDYIKNHDKADIPEKPFKFPYRNTALIPDGRPFVLKNETGATLFLKEIDRCTEAPSTIKGKIRAYKENLDAIKRRYGCNSVMLLFVTTNQTRSDNFLKWVEKEVGSCGWMLTKTIPDYTVLGYRPPIHTELFTDPWPRAGRKPFSLKTLSEVDDASQP